MKKLLFTLLALTMLVTLVACDNGGDGVVTTAEVAESATEAADVTDESTVDSTVDSNESTVAPESTESAETTGSTDETSTEEITTITEPDIMIDVTLDAPYAEDFTVSKVFSSDMVVQRGERLRVWGWADESENGKKVSGEFMGMFSEAIIEDGKWTITFKARLDACSELGNTMKIYTDKKTVEFNDVLVGDVYMVIGQSNVAYKVSQHQDYYGNSAKGAADLLDYDAPIRIHYNTKYDSIGHPDKYPPLGSAEVAEDLLNGREWQRTTKETLKDFSALGYFFAHHLIEMNGYDVPVGIIEIDGNGNCIGTFMSNEAAEAQGTDKYDATKGYYVTIGYNGEEHGRYVYNNHIYPFRNYALAGVIWYQGESDCIPENRERFASNLSALMTHMRSTHNVSNPNFPVYIVEFPPIIPGMDLGPVRAMAGQVPQLLENSYYVVSSDLSDLSFPDNLHPHIKYEQGERLAKLVSAVHMKTMSLEEAIGPIVESVEISRDGKTAVLKFKNCGDGLRTSDGGVNVNGLMGISQRSSSTVKIKATITGTDTITVTSDTALSAIAYNYVSENIYGKEINLCNSYGNPAAAFWIEID